MFDILREKEWEVIFVVEDLCEGMFKHLAAKQGVVPLKARTKFGAWIAVINICSLISSHLSLLGNPIRFKILSISKTI